MIVNSRMLPFTKASKINLSGKVLELCEIKLYE